MIFKLLLCIVMFLIFQPLNTASTKAEAIVFATPDAASKKAQAIAFATPDKKTFSIIRTLPEHFSSNTKALWIDIADGESPYLFLMPSDKCGVSDCTIIGFRHSLKGWKKIYEVFGGDGIKILDTKTQHHKDIKQYESRGADDYVIKISKWHNNQYKKPVTLK